MLFRSLQKQVPKPKKEGLFLVKRDNEFAYKAYGAAARKELKDGSHLPVPICQAVLDNRPGDFPGYERLLRKKRREYECQSRPFSEMEEDTGIGAWLSGFTLWDASLMEEIRLNEIQLHDINLILQKRYALLQWEQGSGKTLAGIAAGLYRMEIGRAHV